MTEDRWDEVREMYAEEAERPLFPPPTAPLDVARKLYSRYRFDGNGYAPSWWCDGWMGWQTTHYYELDAARLRSEIYDALGQVDYKHPIEGCRGRLRDQAVVPGQAQGRQRDRSDGRDRAPVNRHRPAIVD